MDEFVEIEEEDKTSYNASVNHPLQSFEWGKFRKKSGVTVVRRGIKKGNTISNGYTVTFHKIPKLSRTIGYFPKGNIPTKELLEDLKLIGTKHRAVYIQLEPNILGTKFSLSNFKPSFHPLFTKYTFVLDITKSEEDLLKNMHSKTRYNIRVAEKHGVIVQENNSDEAFKEYLRLTNETTKRQRFFAHTLNYHKLQWETLPHVKSKDELSSHLLTAKYKGTILVAWIVFIFKNTLYYPYGASSTENREVMASNLMMWEAIRFGKKHGLASFDMWGALGPEPDPGEEWYGFHRFKEGYGATLTEFIGSYDLVLRPTLYKTLSIADRARWSYLKLRKKL